MLGSVPNIIAASVAISLYGFFNGPLFATVKLYTHPSHPHAPSLTQLTADNPQGISVASKLFHPDSRSTALAFVFVFAQLGGSLFPIITGVIASAAGVKVMQPILISLLGATGLSWLVVPRPKTSGNTALHQE